ncbi:MAG TPA: DUF4221 family protein [Saprospiraceae bacterium]|nr:DUF4221 family protein [Saprospiraceae bacterium]HMP24709.1 DUF4221 family protein [Saprospiraceae bacterium]
MHTSQITLLWFFTFSILFSCKKEERATVQVSSDFALIIPLTTGGTSNYIHHAVYQEKKSRIIALYNRFEHRIELYDVTNKLFIRAIALEWEGPNGINENADFLYYTTSNNQFVIDGLHHIFIIDQTGKTQKKISKYVTYNDIPWRMTRPPGLGVVQHYDDELGSFCYYMYNRDAPRQFLKDEKLRLLLYSINESAHEDLVPIEIPLPAILPEYNGFGQVPNFLEPQILYSGNRIVYNFRFESRFYVFDIGKEKLVEFNPDVQYANKRAEPLLTAISIDELQKTINRNPTFGQFTYDTFRRKYYRFYYTPVIEKTGRRDLCLQIFDDNFVSMAEVNLNHEFLPVILALPDEVFIRMGINEAPDENNIYFKKIIF